MGRVRWRFPQSLDAAESAARRRITQAIDAWWAEFARKTTALEELFSNRSEWDLAAWMRRHLNAIDADLMWEFGPGVNGGDRLVITPEVRHDLRPLVGEILRRAPPIDGWEFYSYRLAESLCMALRTVEARATGDFSGTRFSAQLEGRNRIGLTFHVGPSVDDDGARHRAFVATETLLGEEILDKWIGSISVESARPDDGSEPLELMKTRIDSLIEDVHGSLPSTPYFRHAATAEWTLFKVQPDEPANGDYPNQSDMFVGKTVSVDMWKAGHAGRGFASTRFSRHGETFCYVKLDGREGLDQERFADKSEIEDALDAALVPLGLGCYVGGGTGRWYSYVDLALTDVDRGCSVVTDVLRSGNVPRRSWILFYDDEWAQEWIGVYPDSPRPPIEDPS